MTYLRLAERIVLVTLFLTMSGLFFLSVVTREIGGTFASNFAWIEEAVRFMNIFLVFLGLGLALERGKHVGIDTLRDHLSDPARKVLLKVIDASGFLFSAYMAWLGWTLPNSSLAPARPARPWGSRPAMFIWPRRSALPFWPCAMRLVFSA